MLSMSQWFLLISEISKLLKKVNYLLLQFILKTLELKLMKLKFSTLDYMKAHQEKILLNSNLYNPKTDLNAVLNSEILNLTLEWKLFKKISKLVSKDPIRPVILPFVLLVILDLFKELDLY
jgi:hypothetical protein